MASTNPFDLLGDDDNEDPSLLIQKAIASAAASPKKGAAVTNAAPTKQAKLPTKPVPPTQAGEISLIHSIQCDLITN